MNQLVIAQFGNNQCYVHFEIKYDNNHINVLIKMKHRQEIHNYVHPLKHLTDEFIQRFPLNPDDLQHGQMFGYGNVFENIDIHIGNNNIDQMVNIFKQIFKNFIIDN